MNGCVACTGWDFGAALKAKRTIASSLLRYFETLSRNEHPWNYDRSYRGVHAMSTSSFRSLQNAYAMIL